MNEPSNTTIKLKRSVICERCNMRPVMDGCPICEECWYSCPPPYKGPFWEFRDPPHE